MRTVGRAVLVALALAASVPVAAAQPVRDLFDAYWEDTAKLYPEWATGRGDHRYGDRLSDRSAAGLAREEAYWRSLQAKVRAVDRAALSAQDRLSLDLLQRIADDFNTGLEYPAFRTNPFFFHRSFPTHLRGSPVETAAQLEQMLGRLAAYPARIDQEIVQMKRAAGEGWVPPRAVLEAVLSEIEGQLVAAGKSAYYEPFTRLPATLPEAERKRFQARALEAIEAQVLPATRRLRDFVAGDYLAAAPAIGGFGSYPRGQETYAAQVRIHTTTNLTPRAIHEIGLREVARLRGEMERVMRESGFEGDFKAFVRFLNTDPRFFHGSAEEVLTGFRDIAKRVDPELPRFFAQLPRAPYGIRPLPDFLGPDAAENYSGPALDGTRAGWFNANAKAYKVRPKWVMEPLFVHEAVPGHHLQVARAVELSDLPAFRRGAFFTAYQEGWAVYAETLGPDLGLYKDPYTRFGALQFQIWRAARLVVDTGIHAFGWDRRKAIDYMVERTGLDEGRVASEVDRYFSWPGQALSYMIGQLKILELRDRARAALGARFDLRKFHMVVLDPGPVPLDVLERLVDEWIAAQKKLARD